MTASALLLLKLAWTFFYIGLFTFGGGYAMLSLIQAQVVTANHWISESTFADIVAISQMTPGPIGINSATYVGYEVLAESTGSPFMGVLGSTAATLSIILPSFIIILLIVRFYTKFVGNGAFDAVLGALRPCVAGLIGAAAVILVFNINWDATPLFSPFKIEVVRENFPDWKSWMILLASFAASYWGKLGPVTLIVASAVLGVIIY